MIKKKQQPFLTFKNERTYLGTEYTCTLSLALFIFICAYLMTELGLKMGYSIFFLHIKIENQPLTDCTHLQNILTDHNQLQYYAQHIVHVLV